jgi:hypothetical protein
MDLEAIAAIVAGVVFVALIIIFVSRQIPGSTEGSRAGGLVQLSHLKCEKCGGEFDYAWVPFGSFTAIRLGPSRYFACPICNKRSVFDIWDTRVDPKTHHCDIQIGPS